MKDKKAWYDSLPLNYKQSDEKCFKCGGECIETTDSEETILYACVEQDCKIGFFPKNKIDRG